MADNPPVSPTADGAAGPGPGEVTRLLKRAEGGDRAATEELFPLVYDELRELAAHFLRGEQPGITLQPTALVHEAYVRLAGPGTWQNRAHFFGAAARAVRRILIDHARAKHRLKREAPGQRMDISEAAVAARAPDSLDLMALDEALEELGRLDRQKATVVEMRFFGGMTAEETAEALGVSLSTVARDWAFARAWLSRRLTEPDGAGGGGP